MTAYDITPVQQDYRQLYDGPEPSQLAQLQARPAQLTLPGLEPDPTPVTPPRPTITIDTWPVQPTPVASDPPDNTPPDPLPNDIPNEEPETIDVSGFLFVVKWLLAAALVLAGFIYYL